MTVPDDVIRRAANVYDQCMCDPPLGVAGKDLSFAAMQVALQAAWEELCAIAIHRALNDGSRCA